MGKKVLVTSGTVYGPLDDNKLVGNRVRGIWATKFAHWLVKRGHEVTLLVADTQRDQVAPVQGVDTQLNIRTHRGFWDYRDMCLTNAHLLDAAVMAAAVVNWIPAKPFKGKMPTHGTPGETIMDVPFILAPRVIDGMRVENPKLTLIGCKMTIDAPRDTMIDAAYKTLVDAKCHAVVANDMSGLRAKTVLYPDRAQFDFDIGAEEGENFYRHLEAIILDEHFKTVACGPCWVTEKHEYEHARALFDRFVDRYRERFIAKGTGDRVFGALAVRMYGNGALCSPREKGKLFSSLDAVDVAPIASDDITNRTITTVNGHKATMNAFLLLRHLEQFPSATAVLHLHEQLPDVPTVPYAPPGTVRDNLREIVAPAYNIEGHGCITILDEHGHMYGKWLQ